MHNSTIGSIPTDPRDLKHLLETEPVIPTFDVQSGTSTTHRINARKAAKGKMPEKGGAFSAFFLFSGKAILDSKNFVLKLAS